MQGIELERSSASYYLMSPQNLLAAICLVVTIASLPARAVETLRYSDKPTDEILSRLESGNPSGEINDILALGTRGYDPRLLPLLQKYSKKYEFDLRKKLRRLDPSGGSEIANEDHIRSIELPIELAALKAAARLGDKEAFNHFIVGLSSSNGDYRIECMETLVYIGDRAAFKHLVPIMDDDGAPLATTGHHKPPNYSDVAMSSIRRMMPEEEVSPTLRGFYSASEWRPALKSWWGKNKERYFSMPFGTENTYASGERPPKAQSTEEILSAISRGLTSVEGVLELGSRPDSRIPLETILKIAAQYENRLTRANRERGIFTDPWLLQMDADIRFAAKQVAAKMGEETYFDEFVVGLSSTNGAHKLASIKALGYVGDRAALRHLILLIDDAGSPEKKAPGYEPATYASYAMMQLRMLIPPEEQPESLWNSGEMAKLRADLRVWWQKRKGHYQSLRFGAEKASR